jgi:hypothetical protein
METRTSVERGSAARSLIFCRESAARQVRRLSAATNGDDGVAYSGGSGVPVLRRRSALCCGRCGQDDGDVKAARARESPRCPRRGVLKISGGAAVGLGPRGFRLPNSVVPRSTRRSALRHRPFSSLLPLSRTSARAPVPFPRTAK